MGTALEVGKAREELVSGHRALAKDAWEKELEDFEDFEDGEGEADAASGAATPDSTPEARG